MGATLLGGSLEVPRVRTGKDKIMGILVLPIWGKPSYDSYKSVCVCVCANAFNHRTS